MGTILDLPCPFGIPHFPNKILKTCVTECRRQVGKDLGVSGG